MTMEEYFKHKDRLINSIKSIDGIMDTITAGRPFQGVKTGIGTLDCMTGGLANGHLIILGARPFMGKQTLLGDIAYHAAVEEGKNVLFFSLKKTAETMIARNILHVPDDRDIAGTIQKESGRDESVMAERKERLKRSNLRVEDAAPMSISDIEFVCDKQFFWSHIDLIIIDDLRYIGPSKCTADSRATTREVIVKLKQLAVDLNCPILVATKVSRQCEQRDSKRPKEKDLPDPIIWRAADEILYLYRESLYDRDTANDWTELILAKHRSIFGYGGTIRLRYREWEGLHERI